MEQDCGWMRFPRSVPSLACTTSRAHSVSESTRGGAAGDGTAGAAPSPPAASTAGFSPA